MKRLLAFLILMVLGFVALKLAVGSEQMTTSKGDAPSQPTPQQPRNVDNDNPIRVDKQGTEIQVSGAFTIARMRELPRTGGGVERQKVYELTCRNSMPTEGGRHRLDDVVVHLFDDGEHVATLTATRALVEIEVDDKRQRSLRENRELELENALLTTVLGSKMPPMRFQVRRLLATVDENAVTMHTPDADEPVTVVVDGDNAGELRGLGLTARLPRERGQDGSLLDLVIQRNPVVVMQGVKMQAKKQMHYQEHLASGSACITLEDSVQAELQSRPGSSDAALGKSLAVTGDRMVGWLQRTPKKLGAKASETAGGDARGAMVWTTLRLHGSRAKVTTEAVVLESPRLTVIPGPTGQLAQITADGGDSELRQLGDRAATFRSAQPIHLVRTSPSLGEVHRAFGFPSYGLGLLSTLEIVTFEGAATVDAGDGISVSADRGMYIFRPQQHGDSSTLLARGRGNVRVVHGDGDEQIQATGNSGFFLSRTVTGDVLELGRDDPEAEQEFELTRGKLRLHGRGAARVTRSLAGRMTVRLRSNTPTLAGVFAELGQPLYGKLQQAMTIEAVIVDKSIESFVSTGHATEIDIVHDGQPIRATASRIEQLSPVSWRLDGKKGSAAHLHYEGGQGKKAATQTIAGDLSAPRIEVHRIAERSILLDALADDTGRARLDATAPARTDAPLSKVTTTADRIRVLPWAIGPTNVLRLATGLPAGVLDVVANHLVQPWLLASGSVVADFEDPQSGAVHAESATLAASIGARSMFLSGDPITETPARLHRTEQDQRVLTAEGARIRFAEDDGEHVSVLTTYAGHSQMVPPRVSFRSATKGGGSKLGWLSGECQGEIEVLREAVLFHGPVQVSSILTDGSRDPQGMHVDARELTMRRHRDTGELLTVEAGGGVTMHWRDLFAKSARIELDLRWQRCIAEDDNGAEVRFGGGRSYVARRIEANYATYTVRSYFGRLQQAAPVTVER